MCSFCDCPLPPIFPVRRAYPIKCGKNGWFVLWFNNPPKKLCQSYSEDSKYSCVSLTEAEQHYNIVINLDLSLFVCQGFRNLLIYVAKFPKYPWYKPWHEISRVPFDSLLVQQSVVAAYANQMKSDIKDWVPLIESSIYFRFGCLPTPYSSTPTKLIPGSTIYNAETHIFHCSVSDINTMNYTITSIK